MPFHSDLSLREAPEYGTDYWVLTQPLRYQGAYEHFQVPVGFPTDLASIPGILQPLGFPKIHTSYNRASALHDYLTRPESPVSRRDADGMMRRIVKEEGGGRFRAFCMWLAIRAYSILIVRKP